jgi:hypothetical protein
VSFILFQNYVLHEPVKLNHLIGFAMVLAGVCVVVAGPWHTVVLGRAPDASLDTSIQMLDVPGNHSLDEENMQDKDGHAGNDLQRLLPNSRVSPAGSGEADVAKEVSGAGDAAAVVAT